MSSVVNRSGGGLKLLDTITTSSSQVLKGSDYFSNLGLEEYDLILLQIHQKSGSIYSIYSVIVKPEDLEVSSGVQLRIKDDATSIVYWNGASWIFEGSTTYNIYGINL